MLPHSFRNLLSALIVVLWLANPVSAATCEADTAASGGGAWFKLHLSAGCTEQERESRALEASRLRDALKQGKALDLSGVVIKGDLLLDSLPVGAVPRELESVPGLRESEVRVIPGAVSIVGSVVRGAIKHQSPQGLLVVNGPVTFRGTTFQQMVDLSRTVFAQPVTMSGAVFLKESYFVRGRFMGALTCEKTAFGPHTRFHRTVFQGPVTFQQSGFSGLAEFLEVVFEKDANLSGTYFKMGTGFSGGQFRGMVDFSEALFDREAFFTFAQFDGDAYFRRATFRATADFDDASFKGRDDFSKVFFERAPQFARVKRSGQEPLGLENATVQYVITLSLLIFSALLIVYLIRSR